MELIPKTEELEEPDKLSTQVEHSKQSDKLIEKNEHCENISCCFVPMKPFGYILAFISVISASMLGVLIRMLSFSLNPAEIMAFRNAALTVVAVFLLLKDRKKLKFCKRDFLMVFFMSAADAVGALSNHYAFSILSVAEASAIINCRIIFTLPLAKFWLKEDVGTYEMAIVLLSIVSIVVTSQPPALFGSVAVPMTHIRALGIMWCLLSIMFNSLGKCINRKLKDVHFDYVLFGPSVFSTILGIVMTATYEEFQNPVHVKGGYILIIMIILGLISNSSQLASLQMLLAIESAIISTFRIPLGATMEIIFLGKIPNIPTIIGMILSFISIMLTTLKTKMFAMFQPKASSYKLLKN